MKSIFLTAGALFLVLMAVGSVRTFWIDWQFKSILAPVVPAKTLKNGSFGLPARDQQLAMLQDLGSSPLHVAAIHVKKFSLLNAKAAEETNPMQRMRLYCEALSEIGAALHYEPSNASYLINWANVRQILGRAVECSLPDTNGDFEAAARLALRNDPTNVSVLFAAAQLYDWAGKKDESLAELSRTLLLSTDLKPYQTEFIASRIRTPHDVELVVPARFPQVVSWSSKIQSGNPDLYRAARATFEKLQLSAIDGSLTEYRGGAVPSEIHQQRLLSMFSTAATPAVRRRLDAELASYSRSLGDTTQLTPYLSERGALEEAKVIDASIQSDTRPLKSVLADWGANTEMCLDDFYSSVGFFLPEGESPKLIELQGRRKDAQILPATLKILVSDDNQAWSELEGNVNISSVQFGESKIIAIHPNSRYFKYWKVNFSSNARTRSFCNSAQRLVTVYRSSSAGPS